MSAQLPTVCVDPGLLVSTLLGVLTVNALKASHWTTQEWSAKVNKLKTRLDVLSLLWEKTRSYYRVDLGKLFLFYLLKGFQKYNKCLIKALIFVFLRCG